MPYVPPRIAPLEHSLPPESKNTNAGVFPELDVPSSPPVRDKPEVPLTKVDKPAKSTKLKRMILPKLSIAKHNVNPKWVYEQLTKVHKMPD